MLDAVVFDFDGVIVDTEPIHFQAFLRVLEPLGLSFTWEEYLDRYIGYDDRDAFRAAFESAGRPLLNHSLAELIAEKTRHFMAAVEQGVPSYPGVTDLVNCLSGQIPLALCSGALLCDIEPILSTLGLTECFSVIVSAEQVSQSKPDPQSYRLVLKRLQQTYESRSFDPQRCLAIEDTPAGIDSAQGAGIPVVAVCNSFAPEMLSSASAIVNSLEGLDLKSLEGFLV